MKKTVLFILAGVVALFASCAKEKDNQRAEDPVYVTVSMDPETKATLAEADGAFAFSSGDAIKIWDGSGLYSGTTTSTSNSGDFAMESGFDVSGSGFAGFPASLVSDITGSGVTFALPSTYPYDEVGGADPDAAKVISPMIGTYTSGGKISLKQAGAVIRLRLTNVAAGSVTFTFGTNVTGTCTITTPSGTNDGILPSGLGDPGKSITVTDVPAVTSGDYIYITIPVPTKVKPQNIAVTNAATSGDNRIALVVGSGTALNRAGGYKKGVALTEAPGMLSGIFTVSGSKVHFSKGNLQWSGTNGWRFAPNQYTYIGDAANNNAPTTSDGNYLDLFCWGSSGLNGIAPNTNDSYKSGDEALTGSNDWGYNAIDNGGKTTAVWRTLTKDDWEILFSSHTYDWSTVAGVDGYVIRPDGVTTAVASSYTADEWLVEEAAGAVFLPAAGKRAYYNTGSGWINKVEESGSYGYYWSSSQGDGSEAFHLYFNSSSPIVEVVGRRVGHAVRLVRDAIN